MTCNQTEKVSLLIDSELPPLEIAGVKQHVQECSDCRAAHESFLLLRSQLNSYVSTVDAAAIDAALVKIISPREKYATPPVSRGWRERLAAFGFADTFTPRFAAAAGLIVLAVTIGIVALLLKRQDTELAQISPSTPVTAGTPDQISDARRPQAPKPGSGQPAKSDKAEKPKPAQTPARNVPRAPRRRPEMAPNYSAIEDNVAANNQSLEGAEVELITARHLEQSELLLRAFRNVKSANGGRAPEIRYERQRAQKLLYQNMLVRREADATGDVQVSALLGSLEPILLDIANLSDKPRNEEVVAIKDRMERKSLVPLLQINSAAVARAYE
ncbi:MAG: zf-HC2 domain-containing protein [Acidobacteriota bacterium]|nr:zf-HC2 domain-containing protein [Acidobacteriota bacterium]